MNSAGYAPLSLVYRMTGDADKSIALADRGINFLAEAGVRSAANGASQAELDALIREAGRLVAARALAVFMGNPQEGIQQMRVAMEMAGGDRVVISLSKQLESFLEQLKGVS